MGSFLASLGFWGVFCFLGFALPRVMHHGIVGPGFVSGGSIGTITVTVTVNRSVSVTVNRSVTVTVSG